jgi:hypothetical protein
LALIKLEGDGLITMKNGCYHLLPEKEPGPDRDLITYEDRYCLVLAQPCPFDSEEHAKEACQFFDHPTKEEVEAWYQGILERRSKDGLA